MEVSLYSLESVLPYYIRGVCLIILIARTNFKRVGPPIMLKPDFRVYKCVSCTIIYFLVLCFASQAKSLMTKAPKVASRAFLPKVR